MWDLLAADGLGYNCDFYCLKSRICRKGTQFIVIFWLLYKKMKVHEANCICRRDERNFGKKSNKSRWGWLSESFEVMRVAMAAKNDVTRSSVNRGPFTWYESTANFELFGVKPGNCKFRKKRTHSRRAIQLIFRKNRLSPILRCGIGRVSRFSFLSPNVYVSSSDGSFEVKVGFRC